MRMFLSTLLAASVAVAAGAQTPEPVDPNAASVAETARLNAETARINADASRMTAEAARITALGLPSFEGKTTIDATAGKIEATLLTAQALGDAATMIADDVGKDGAPGAGSDLLVLAGDEAIEFGLAGLMKVQMETLTTLFDRALGLQRTPGMTGGEKFVPVSTAVAAISAVAGLLRTETTVTGIDDLPITHRMLATAIAGRLPNAVLPSAFVGTPTSGAGVELIDQFNELAALRDTAAAERKKIGKKKDARAAPIDAAVARYDAFFLKVTTPDDKGVVPIVQAARYANLLGDERRVLRVNVDEAGGSVVNTKNIATTFGVDPVKVSGGLLVSYTLTDPNMGRVLAGNVLHCRTTLASLRRVQEARWTARPARRGAANAGGCERMVTPMAIKTNGGDRPVARRKKMPGVRSGARPRLGYDLARLD